MWICLAVALPVYGRVASRAKESELRSELFTMRRMIDEYRFDRQTPPLTLSRLVSRGYLSRLPEDPMTGSRTSWKAVLINGSAPGLQDVHSGSDRIALDGTAYSNW